jgi:hypothetical protein
VRVIGATRPDGRSVEVMEFAIEQNARALAFGLLLYTGQRGGDAAGRNNRAAELSDLRKEIAAVPGWV